MSPALSSGSRTFQTIDDKGGADAIGLSAATKVIVFQWPKGA